MLAPPGTQSQPLSSHMSNARVSTRWLALARGTWVVCALLLLANFVASIPAYYRIMLTVCTLPNHVPCTMPGNPGQSSGQLTPDNVAALAHLHLSLATYAAFVVTVTVVVSLLYWGFGLLIFWRKSDEWMGLFVSLLLVLFGATGVNDYLLGAYAPTPSPLFLQILLNLIGAAQWLGICAFLLTFPTGRFVPHWSWLLILGVISYPLLQVYPLLQAAAMLVVIGSILFIMVYRYVRVFDVVQRQQTKWLVYLGAVGISLYVICSAFSAVMPADSPYQLLSTIINVLSLAFIPFGVGIAILRYRLWDIDVIINRTLVYGSLTALLALLYFGLIFVLQTLFQGLFHQNNAVAIVVSTLAIAALFQPLRHRIQRFIDRRFYRSKYDAAKTLEAFSATLRNEVDLSQLREHLLTVVQETMQPAHVSLWLRPSEHDRTHQAPWRANPPVDSKEA